MKQAGWIEKLFIAVAMGLPASAWADAHTPAEAAAPPDGSALYAQHCATCHGAQLEGGIGSNLVDHQWNYGESPGMVMMTVMHGIPNLEMPGWKDVLTQAEIMAVVGYVFEQEAAAQTQPPPVPQSVATELYALKVEVLNDRLETPWAMDFIDASHALVTDRAGQLYQLVNDKLLDEPVKGTPPDIGQGGQAGLFDVVIDPDYASNGWIYLSYAQLLDPAAAAEDVQYMTRIVRGRIKDGQWLDEQVIYQAAAEHFNKIPAHFGARMVIDDEGHLFFSLGDRAVKEEAQDRSRPNGNIHRINTDGSIPADNPFVHEAGTIPSIYSYGHRNPQGLALNRLTRQVWSTEHGPWGGDELNLILPGRNYGWPAITYGHDYDGSVISEFTEKPGMEQPVKYWTPSIALFNLDFYQGNQFPEWRNNILVTSLKYKDLRRLVLEDNQVVHEEILVKGIGRMRSVKVSPDGAVYVLSNEPSLILRFTPQ